MHESSLVAGIIDVVTQEVHKAQGHGITHVTHVHVSIGFFTCIDAVFLQECFGLMREESPYAFLHGTALHVTRRPLQGHCETCQARFELHKGPFRCPHCQQSDLQFDGLYGCTVDSIDIC